MKIFKLLTLAFTAVILSSCGGSSTGKITSNPHLGKIPSAFRELDKEMERIMEYMRSEGQKITDEKQATALMEKCVAMENKAKTETYELCQKEMDRLDEKPVPVEIAYDSDLEIVSAVFDKWGSEATTGVVSVIIDFSPKRAMKADRNASMTYQMLDTDGNVIFGYSLNPFAGRAGVADSGAFPNGTPIEAGGEINMNGSQIMIRCGSYDFTNFDKIVFTNGNI